MASNAPGVFVAEIEVDRSKFIFPDTAETHFQEARKLIEAMEHEKAKEKLKLAADENHPVAIHELGCYLQLDKKYEESFSYFKRGLDLGFPPSIYNIAIYYSSGLGVEKDINKAFDLCKQAAKLGHARAQYQLGTFYREGQGTEVNSKKALKWFHRAADQGDAYAPCCIAIAYMNGIEGVIEKNPVEARTWLEKGAPSDVQAQYLLAMLCKGGIGGEKDMDKAIEYLTMAAQNGHDAALYQLGVIMVNSGNVQGGLSFLQLASQKAVAKQDAKRLYEIGAFFEGHGKINAAVPLYKAGAMLGHPGCQFNLGLILTMSDDPTAIVLIQSAASQGHVEATYCLGKVFLEGFCNVPINKDEGIKYLTKAASMGSTEAAEMLAGLSDKSHS